MNKNILITYIITHDTGFAPNPFHGFSSLACCKPKIREKIWKTFTADINCWITGLARKEYGNKIIYTMKVDKVITFDEYFINPEYAMKKPDFSGKENICRYGDNIYKPAGGDYIQLRSLHSKNYEKDDWQEDEREKKRDLESKYVLISERFYYFGSKAIELPEELSELKVGQGFKANFREETIDNFLEYIQKFNDGINGNPSDWK